MKDVERVMKESEAIGDGVDVSAVGAEAGGGAVGGMVDGTVDGTVGSNSENAGGNAFLACFVSTFVTIFLAEVGDKTQVAVLLMSAQSHRPWIVFGGAAGALVATSLVGVLLGRWLGKWLSPRVLRLVTGGILAVVAVLLTIDIVRGI